MRTYEALFIVRPDAKDEEVQTIAKEVENLITNDGGAIVRSEIWGKRRLAYEVKKFNEGVYVLIRFTSTAVLPKKMEEYFRISDTVIRSLIVAFDEHTLALEIEQARRVEAELARTGGRGRDDDRDGDRDRDRDRDRGGRRGGRDRDDDDDD